MGDVMFDTAFKDKGFGKADKDKITGLINNEDSKYHGKTPQEVHDAIYKELNSTNFSFYIENHCCPAKLQKQGCSKNTF